jgi:hypothetical protein
MKKQQRLSVLLALGLAVACSPAAIAGRVLSTHFPGGADGEIREDNSQVPRSVIINTPTANANGNAPHELGTQVSATVNRHSLVKFNIRSVNAANLLHPITVRTHWALSNLGANRIEDPLDLSNQDTAPADGVDDTPFADRPNVKLDYYVLDPNNVRADWSEKRLAYRNGPATAAAPWGAVAAPGIAFDGVFTTKDILTTPGNYTYLGENELRTLNHAENPTTLVSTFYENRIPIGEAFDVTFPVGSPLHTAIAQAQLPGSSSDGTVTVLLTVQHTVANSPSTQWLGFNYAMMTKERPTVSVGNAPTFGQNDGYDNDTRDSIDWDPVASGINPPNSPWQNQPNTLANSFAPQLRFIPEPGSMLLAGVCGLSLLMRRRMA